MMGRVERHPYVLIREIQGRQYAKIQYVHKDDFQSWMLNRDVPEKALGISEELASFIREYCTCAYCHSAVSFDLKECSCGGQKRPHIEVQFSGEMFNPVFLPLLKLDIAKQLSVAKAIRRRERLAATQTAYSEDEILSLLYVQEHSCYYCGRTLISEEGRNKYHIDHYVALSNGGVNDIQNLVLACPECNLKKSWKDGRYFSSLVTKSLDVEMKIRVKKIKAKVRSYKKRLCCITD